jgi:hypothetical protein
MMNSLTALALTAAALALPNAAHAAGNSAIPGYYDPATRMFMPMIVGAPAAAPVSRSGTVKITITLNIQSSVGTDAPLTCQASISTFDASFQNSASASNVVTRSGAKGTAVLSIPYNWTMAAANESVLITSSCSESTFGAGGVGHSITFTVPGFTVPTKSGTTTKSLTASL